MQVRAGVEMLAVLVVVSLAARGSEGLSRCEVRKELTLTLPTTVLDRMKNQMAKIVCQVELMTGFNTSVVTNITNQEKQPRARRARSAPGMDSKESAEESRENVPPKPKPGFRSSTIMPTTTSQGNASTNGTSHGPRYVRAARSSIIQESQGNHSSTGSGHGKRRARSAHDSSSEGSNEESMENNITPPPRPQGNDTTPRRGHGDRHARSAHDSSSEGSNEESNEDDIIPFFTGIIPPSDPQGNDSFPRRGHGERHARSVRMSSSEEENDNEEWVFYGLFQLPGHIVCTSGSEFSLNICNMTCNSLLDNNIKDDITCLGTVLNDLLPAGKKPGSAEKAIRELYDGVYKKACVKVVDSQYFSKC